MALDVMRRDRTRRQLMEAARRLFTRLGYEGATVDDVAREAGYSKGAYYFHFASKEDVLLALVEDWAERRSRLLEAAVDGQPPAIALADLLDALISSDTEDGDARLLLEFWSQGERNPKVRQRLTQAYRSWHDLLVRAFRRAQEMGVFASDGEPEAAADAALAFHDGLVVQHCLGQSTGSSSQVDTEALVELLTGWRAVRATNAGERRAVQVVG